MWSGTVGWFTSAAPQPLAFPPSLVWGTFLRVLHGAWVSSFRSRGEVPRGLSLQPRLQGLRVVDRLSSQAVCLRGEWSRRVSGGRGPACYRNRRRMSLSATMIMGKTERPGLPLVKVFPRSDGLPCQYVVFSFAPKGWFNEEKFSREKGNAHTEGNASAAGGAVSAAGGRTGWSSEVFPHFSLIGQVQAGG